MPTDSDFTRLADETRKHRLLKFDPTINAGTIAGIVLALIGFGAAWNAVQAGLTAQNDKTEAVKTQATVDRTATKEALTEIKGDVKEMSRTLGKVEQTLAVIEARQQQTKGKP